MSTTAREPKANLAHRKPVDASSSTGLDVSNLDPDYVVVVNLKGPLSKNEEVIRATTQKLASAGFLVTVRPGLGATALVIVSITPKTLQTVALQAQARDWTAGVSTPAIDFANDDGVIPAQRNRLIYEAIVSSGVLQLPSTETSFPVGSQQFNSRLAKTAFFHWTLDWRYMRLHYGEEVGFLFAFFRYMLKQLVVPVIFGAGWWVFDSPHSKIISVLLLVWAAVYLIYWRHLERKIAASWNTTFVQRVKTPRAGYKKTPVFTTELRGALFVPVAILLGLIYLAALVSALGLEVFFTQLYDGPVKIVAKVITVGANIVSGIIFSLVYGKVLNRWLEWEDPETEEDYSKKKGQRLYFATFLQNFLPLFLTAYLYLPFGHLVLRVVDPLRQSVVGQNFSLVPQFYLNTERLRDQAVFFSVTNQLVGAVTDTGLPLALAFAKSKIWPDKKGGADAKWLRFQQSLPKFDPSVDYLVIITTFGYVMLLTPVWPFAPLCSLIALFIRAKCTVFKLALVKQPPHSLRANSIGIWNSNILFLAAVCSIATPTISLMFSQTTSYNSFRSYVAASPISVLAAAFISENVFIGIVRLAETVTEAFPVPIPAAPAKQSVDADISHVRSAAWKEISLDREISEAAKV